ncbi:hypothetical protein BDM02DRAFT_939434 [Thelephora ganbajun]|uniref:Uncharacterized protein n=1 Tax=Thelephora ganbajun TaxID=370292 RepID=A0ACB6Z4B4_THEGA|nr:hypothetical protein BDM02DRAFT_939434 [Thelephora ganbajun]
MVGRAYVKKVSLCVPYQYLIKARYALGNSRDRHRSQDGPISIAAAATGPPTSKCQEGAEAKREVSAEIRRGNHTRSCSPEERSCKRRRPATQTSSTS